MWLADATPRKQHHPTSNAACVRPLFAGRGEVKRAVLSRAANLWSYLLNKSIEVSESRAECAGGEAAGATPGPLPPGHLLGGTCLSLPRPSLLPQCSPPATTCSHTHTHTCATRPHILRYRRPMSSCSTICTVRSTRGSTLSEMLHCKCRTHKKVYKQI